MKKTLAFNMNWEKIAESEYVLREGDRQLATMRKKGNAAECRIGDRLLKIRTAGFWGNRMELTDASGQILAMLKPVNWYGTGMQFRLDNRDYQLLVRNNPLAEYAVQQNGRDLVAYGLKTREGRAVAAITDHRQKPLIELDLLLWFLFAPVAQGETGDAGTSDLDLLLLSV